MTRSPHVYVHSDVPSGMTLSGWRRAGPEPALTRREKLASLLFLVACGVAGWRTMPYQRQPCACQQPPERTTSSPGERW